MDLWCWISFFRLDGRIGARRRKTAEAGCRVLLARVLPSLEVTIMDNLIIFIKKQVYKNGTHFGGQIPKGFEMFLRGHPCHVDGQFECDQPQYRSTDFYSPS